MDSSFEDVFLEVAVLYPAIGESHATFALLNAIDPLSFVYRTISPVHLSIPLLRIHRVLALETAARFPLEFTVSVLLIILVLTLVLVGVIGSRLFPQALPILLTVIKLARVEVAVGPGVLAEALSLAPFVLTYVHVADRKLVAALTMP